MKNGAPVTLYEHYVYDAIRENIAKQLEEEANNEYTSSLKGGKVGRKLPNRYNKDVFT